MGPYKPNLSSVKRSQTVKKKTMTADALTHRRAPSPSVKPMAKQPGKKEPKKNPSEAYMDSTAAKPSICERRRMASGAKARKA